MPKGCCARNGAASRFQATRRRYSILLKHSDSPAFDSTSNAPASKTRGSSRQLTKLFVLDTNVLMHDPTSLYRFEEHDIFLPIATLEELDSNKKGLSEVSRNARQASRFLDEIVSTESGDIAEGIALKR